MFCIALTSSLPEEYLKNADVIAENFEEIGALVDPSALRQKLRVALSLSKGRSRTIDKTCAL